MALIETTDMAFEGVSQIVGAREAALRAVLAGLADQYYNATGLKSDDSLPLALTVIESLHEFKPESLAPAVEQFRATHSYLNDIVRERRTKNHLYAQAVVFLLYYLIDRYRSDILDTWPLTRDEIAPLFTDLGIAMQ
jgi:hypothetical protein